MDKAERLERQYQLGLKAPLAWSPTEGGRRGWVCFEDDLTEDLGEDPTGEIFEEISERMLSGRHYPVDAVEFFGRFRDEERHLKAGDRVLQRARVFPFWAGMTVWSMVEIYVASRTEDRCEIGYVTTTRHHGRGIWRAVLRREGGRLYLDVKLTASPNSWLFWMGLPYARWVQVRARKRASEEYRKMLNA